jgi:nitrate/nitrite transporter NarK
MAQILVLAIIPVVVGGLFSVLVDETLDRHAVRDAFLFGVLFSIPVALTGYAVGAFI